MKRLLLPCFFLFIGIILSAQSGTVLLRTDFDAQVTEGSVEQLITALQNGKSIRLGWQFDFDNDGIGNVEHWIDANFISILGGHVFNQTEPIYRQVPKTDIPQIEIVPSNTKWTAIIGSNGKMLHRFTVPDLAADADEAAQERWLRRAKVREDIVSTVWVIK